MADGIVFDKTSYKAGDKAVVTVTQAGRVKSDAFNFTTAAGTLTSTTTLTADAPASALTHTLPGTVTKVSDDGTVAVYNVQY